LKICDYNNITLVTGVVWGARISLEEGLKRAVDYFDELLRGGR